MALKKHPAAGRGTDQAEAVGVKALQFIAGEPALAERFLALTGLEPDGLRAASREPGFFAGVLDFVLAHEPTLLAFAAAAAVAPESVLSARAALDGPAGDASW